MLSPKRSAQEILQIRRESLNPAMSVSYQQPLKIVRGEGVWLYDEEGIAYLDMVNNVSHVGHCHPRVVAAACEQMALLNTNSRYLHDHLAEYSQRLTGLFPEPLSVAFFCCSGSEANDLALRLARATNNGTEIIPLEAAYHGTTQTLIDISPYKHAAQGGSGAPDFVHPAPLPDNFRGIIRDSQHAGPEYARYVEQAADEIQRSGKQLLAFISESQLGCGGQIVLPDDYLRDCYRAARSVGGVCIADEVQVGFGRCGTHMWAFEQQNVVPDIVTLGKPIGNGHPMAAVITSREIADAFANGMEYFNTFAANPVSCAIGLAVLEVIEAEGLQQNALQVGEFLLQGMRELQQDCPVIGDVRGSGLFLGMELVNNVSDREPNAIAANAIVRRMRHKKVLLSSDGPDHNVVKMKPPLVLSKENAVVFLQRLDESLRELNYRKSEEPASFQIL